MNHLIVEEVKSMLQPLVDEYITTVESVWNKIDCVNIGYFWNEMGCKNI